jgi:hypothetical protein
MSESQGVTMFKSGLTKGIYQSFLRDYQLDRSELTNAPFIYADPESGEVKYLTNLMSTSEVSGEILALSIAGAGDVEVLSTEN